MHGDFTRDSFDRKHHYSGIRLQQGRVLLDADYNEQTDISLYLERTANADVIGAVGAPYADPGDLVHFRVDGGSLEALQVAPGRIYVNGVLVENEAVVSLDEQPDLPPNEPIVRVGDSLVTLAEAPEGKYAIILKATEQQVTAIEEPSLREVALGPHGPDTTTRVRTVWQVYLHQMEDDSEFNCVAAQDLLPPPSRGRLTSSVQDPAPATDPCEPGGAGGYRGLENQLYRVEIHEGGDRGTATFKWSRENGSVVVAVDDFIEEPADVHTKVLVSTLGRDEALGLAETQWVELVDDYTVQRGGPGTLARIDDIKPAVGGGYVIELSEAVTAHVPPDGEDPTSRHPRLRRWDQSKELQADGTVLTAAGPIELDPGVQVEFPDVPDGEGPEFRTGDYWIFAARASTGNIEELAEAPPRDAKHYALLALVDWDGANLTDEDVHDCRPIFPPATDMVQLLYVGGDGQQGTAGTALPAPLQVSVALGRFPVENAHVRFAVVAGSGSITPTLQALDADGDPILNTAATDAEGVAACSWTLGHEDVQMVEARLLMSDTTDAPNPPVRYSATQAIGVEADPGVEIKGVFWLEIDHGERIPAVPAVNDHPVPMHRFLNGLAVECSELIEPASVVRLDPALGVGRPTCFVTLDLPFPIDHPTWGGGITGYQRIILDAWVEVEAQFIRWWLNDAAHNWIDTTVREYMRASNLARLLTRLTLKGNFIWQQGQPTVYLDGEALGTPDGDEPHNLRLPSGDGRSGGDFEMWFWLELEEEEPPPGGEIVWDMYGLDNIVSLDPVRVNDTYDDAIIDLLYAGLVRLDEKMDVVPDLAENWEFSPEGHTLTFFLRNDTAFSDGSPLTAEDVKFSLERALDVTNGWSGFVYLSAISSIAVVDDFEVRLEAEGTFPRFFLSQLTTAPAKIVSKAAVEADPEGWDEDPITSGAFGVLEWQRGAGELILERNSNYWQPASIEKIILSFMGAQDHALTRYMAGESHVLSSLQSDVAHSAPPEVWDQLVPSITPPFGLRYVGFNQMLEGPLSDLLIRRALALALDRDQIVEMALDGTVQRAMRLAPPGLVDRLEFNCDIGDLLPFDLDLAEEQMQEAGFSRGADGIWLSPDGNQLTIRLTFAAEGNNELVVNVIAQQWNEFGVLVDLEGIGDLRELSNLLHAMHADPDIIQAYYSIWVTDYADPQNILSQQLHTVLDDRHANNNGHYSHDVFDSLVDTADGVSPLDVTLQEYCKAELNALEQVAWLPLFYAEPRALIREGVEGLVVTGEGIVIPDFSALSAPE